MGSDLQDTDLPRLNDKPGATVKRPWAKRVFCYDCDWSEHVESRADDGGASACRRVMRQHRRKTGHEHFGMLEARPRRSRRPKFQPKA